MTPDPTPPRQPPAAAERPFLRLLLQDQRQRWRRGERVSVETYLERQGTVRRGAKIGRAHV